MEINAIPFAYEAEENAMTSNVTKRCYNEDYWVHVRE